MVRARSLPDGVTAPVTRGRSIQERRKRASSSKRSLPSGLRAGFWKDWSTMGTLAAVTTSVVGPPSTPVKPESILRPDQFHKRRRDSRPAGAAPEPVEELAHAGEEAVALGMGLTR